VITRFELLVIVRNQVRDRALVRRALALEAVLRGLARAAGADEALWGLAGLGADIDVRLAAGNPARRGLVAAEILATEGVPEEATSALAARLAGAPDTLAPLARALVLGETLVALALADLDDAESGMTLAALEPAQLAHRLARAARRGDAAALRALACADHLGLGVDAAAAAAHAGLVEARQDLGL
jgi:predicted hydrolase (HD superfamily)